VADIKIIEVSTKKELMQFIKLPMSIYRNEKYYVPHLIADRKKFFDKNKNPFFKHAKVKNFLAFKNGRPVGRISGIINHLHNNFHNEKTGFFGFFDFIDDSDVSSALFKAAADFAKSEGMDIIRGPMNFSTNDEGGLLIDGFDSLPCFMMTYNPVYHIEHYDNLGLVKTEDLLAFYINVSHKPTERKVKIVEKLRQRSRIKIRKIDMDNFESELEIIRVIYNSAWSKNWGFVPMTEEEFQHIADDFKKIIDPELVFIAFVDDEPAGFLLAMPDYNLIFKKMNGRLFPFGLIKFLYYTKIKRIVKSLRVITMGIVLKYQKIGLDSILFMEIYQGGPARGYDSAEMSWILESNKLMVKAAEGMGTKAYKRYRIYDKDLKN
jgi:hypothetical protein